MVSPDSETVPNSLVLVGHGIHGDIRRLEEMKISMYSALIETFASGFPSYQPWCSPQEYLTTS